MSGIDRQDAFDATVKYLLVTFPKRGDMVSMDELWEENDKYLPQIVSLAYQWSDSQEKQSPLKPTTDLCDLMANAG